MRNSKSNIHQLDDKNRINTLLKKVHMKKYMKQKKKILSKNNLEKAKIIIFFDCPKEKRVSFIF